MRSCFDAIVDSVVGIARVQRESEGVSLHRLPAWTDAQITDERVRAVAAMPAGGRLRFATNSKVFELDCLLTLVKVGALVRPATFDVMVDGEVVSSVECAEGAFMVVDIETGENSFEPGPPSIVSFELPGNAESVVEIWLPHATMVQLRDARIADGCSIFAVPDDRPIWVHHGSSISHAGSIPHPAEGWPALVSAKADVSLQSFGMSGECQLDQFMARTIRDLPADLISVKIGINLLNMDAMRRRNFIPALHGFLDTIRDGHPVTPLLVSTPVFLPIGEDTPGPHHITPEYKMRARPRPEELKKDALTMKVIRAAMSEVIASRQQSDANLYFLDGLTLLSSADAALFPDDLHPNLEGNRLLAERFHTAVFVDGPFRSQG